MVLDLDHPASIDIAVAADLDTVPEDARSDEWDRRTNSVKAFKKAIDDHCSAIQDGQCVWCELEIGANGRRSVHRDHIAPKSSYGKWTFEPMNIALACEYCNGFAVKGRLDTVDQVGATYSNSSFVVVHPYLDTPDLHIVFVEEERIAIQALSEKGRWTIEKLQLDSPTLTKVRAMDRVLQEAEIPADKEELLKQALRGLGA